MSQQYPQFQHELEVIPAPTAWKSVPGAVRVAVWVWAISILLSLAMAVVLGVLFLLGFYAAILS